MFGYLRHFWTDTRFAGRFNETIRLKGSIVEKAWTPDTYVGNSRESNMRVKDSESDSMLEIYPNGRIFYSKGLVPNPTSGEGIDVVVQFCPWFKFSFVLFWDMVICDNEFETKKNKI